MEEIVLDENLELVGNLLMKNLLEETDYANQHSQNQHSNQSQNKKPSESVHTQHENPPYLMVEPKCVGTLDITIKTQIQTNRRTNFYIDANWPEEMLNKKFPIFYYPPVNPAIHDPLNNVMDPKNVWLSEMAHYYYGTSSYMEVQFWMKLDDRMKMILKCNTHPTIIKLPGQQYDEKTISSAEAKWARNTIIFGVNFNCTRTCFKSEIYIFVRIRSGHYYMESGLVELPFRRSEKRKNDGNMQVMPIDYLNVPTSSKRQLLHTEPRSFEFGPQSFDSSHLNHQQPLLPNVPLDHINNPNYAQHIQYMQNHIQQQHIPIQYQTSPSPSPFNSMMEVKSVMVPKSISNNGPGFGSGHSPPNLQSSSSSSNTSNTTSSSVQPVKKPLNVAITQSLAKRQNMQQQQQQQQHQLQVQKMELNSNSNPNFGNIISQQFGGHNKTFNSVGQELAFFDWDGESDIYKSSFGMDSFHHGDMVNHNTNH